MVAARTLADDHPVPESVPDNFLMCLRCSLRYITIVRFSVLLRCAGGEEVCLARSDL